jgi:hypothetical protein
MSLIHVVFDKGAFLPKQSETCAPGPSGQLGWPAIMPIGSWIVNRLGSERPY